MPLTSPYSTNRATPAPTSTVGLKISKPGYSSASTAGSNLIYNSSWPSLSIAYQKVVTNTVTSSSASLLTVPHGLGYPPFTIIWAYGTDPSGLADASLRFFPMVDTQNVYIDKNMGNTIVGNQNLYAATQLAVVCFQLDLSIDIDYTLAPGDTFNLPYDPNFGFKVVKDGRSITSKDMRDFSVHSRCQSPLVLAVKTEKTIPSANINVGGGASTLYIIQYKSPFTYPSWVYGYVKLGYSATGYGVPTGTYRYAPYYAPAGNRTTTDGLLTYVNYTGSGAFADLGASIVVLRDPMFAATQSTIQY